MLRLVSAIRPLWELRGHHDEAIAQLERGLALGGDDGKVPPAVRLTAFAGLGRHYKRLGQVDTAQAWFDVSLKLANELGDRQAIATALYAIGGAEINRERYDLAATYLEQALAIYEELNDPKGVCACHYLRGIGAYGEGRLADGVAEIEAALRARRANGPVFNLSVILNALGLLRGESREIEPAIAALTESRSIWRSSPGTNQEVQAEWLVAAAFLEYRRGQPWLAARLGGAAEALTEAIKVPLVVPPPRQYARWVAELRVEVGDLAFEGAWSAGRGLSVRDAVDEALAPPDPDHGDLALLSPREREVLALVDQGKSDREIADELFLSVRTIEGHVARMLTKLGVRSRAEAVRLAATKGRGGEGESV
jgi:non-specific serine/threonine protein kinase